MEKISLEKGIKYGKININKWRNPLVCDKCDGQFYVSK